MMLKQVLDFMPKYYEVKFGSKSLCHANSQDIKWERDVSLNSWFGAMIRLINHLFNELKYDSFSSLSCHLMNDSKQN